MHKPLLYGSKICKCDSNEFSGIGKKYSRKRCIMKHQKTAERKDKILFMSKVYKSTRMGGGDQGKINNQTAKPRAIQSERLKEEFTAANTAEVCYLFDPRGTFEIESLSMPL